MSTIMGGDMSVGLKGCIVLGKSEHQWYREFSWEHMQERVELIGGKTKDLEERVEVRKLSEEGKKEEEEAGGEGELRLGDHKGNYLRQPAKSPIKLESTTQ